MSGYVHGYSSRERERLHDQADILNALLQEGLRYPAGAKVLEAGAGVGAQTAHLLRNSPGIHLYCMDVSPASLTQAKLITRVGGGSRVDFFRGDIFALPLARESMDHLFLCFVLEHLAQPLAALKRLLWALKPGGSVTVIEGDHGSCRFHPETEAARDAWHCLIGVQKTLAGNSLIGRQVYPLLHQAGLEEVAVLPRNVYCDHSQPRWRDGFVNKIIIPMVEGIRGEAIAAGMIAAGRFDAGIADLHRTGEGVEGVFDYTFYRGTGLKAK